MNQLAPRTHNNPPDPIDEAVAPYGDAITEAANWLDGEAITTVDQMKAVDAVLKDIKSALKAVTDGEKSAAAPLHDAWKAEKARWKPTIDDLTAQKNGLVKLVDAVKRAEAEAQRQREAKARAEAEAATRAAAEAARKADATNLEAQREARAAQDAADAAQRQAAIIAKNTVKGLRTVTLHEVEDYGKLLNWVARNDKPAMAAFLDEYARKNTSARPDGVRVWQDRVAV